jgi:hypothetical protein
VTREAMYTCAGCGGEVRESEVGSVWMETPLGRTCVKTHRDQACARLAVENEREQPARRVPRPAPVERMV